MSFTTVRYRIKPEHQADNRARIEAVIADLEQQAPEGYRYMALQHEDGTFIHIVDGDGTSNPFGESAAFKHFLAGLEERQAEPTDRKPAQLIGQYRMLAGKA